MKILKLFYNKINKMNNYFQIDLLINNKFNKTIKTNKTNKTLLLIINI